MANRKRAQNGGNGSRHQQESMQKVLAALDNELLLNRISSNSEADDYEGGVCKKYNILLRTLETMIEMIR